jgi:hypothetical protein
MKYRVVTEVSSMEDAELDHRGRQILFETDDFQQALKECVEWSDWDDIKVLIINQANKTLFVCSGAGEAWERFSDILEAV